MHVPSFARCFSRDLNLAMTQSRHIMLAVGFAVVFAVARWCLECLVVVPLAPDPQTPIWIMISSITCVFIAVTLAPLAWLALRGLRSESSLIKCVSWVPLLSLLAWYSFGFISLAYMRSALVDSANPTTKAERLRELANYKDGPGYEIDNRVAKHPNTPPDVLRALHGRPEQVGTEMCLAQNPNTPDDVLMAIADRNDEWSESILHALKRNPRYAEVFATQTPITSDVRELVDVP